MLILTSSAPPTAVRNLRNTTRSVTTLTVQWDRPTTIGRDDYYYVVEYSDSDNNGTFITSIDNFRNTATTVTYEITGLTSATEYTIRVSVHNGVSDQDPENAHKRIREIKVSTLPLRTFSTYLLLQIIL